MYRCLALLAVGLLSLVLTAAAPASLAPGAVVGLAGTPHLWIADAQGVLHWGGDTRALAGKHVNWSDRRDVSLSELQAFPIGDPWLSAGLLKDGDPIYQVKWETEWPLPKLLHIQSIKDVELFGIDGSNYGNFVLDKSTWEQRYGIDATPLERQPLASAVPPGVTLSLNRVVAGAPPAPVSAHPAPPPLPDTSWTGVTTVPPGVVHRVEHDGETWEVTVLESVRGQAFEDRIAQHKRSYSAYRPPPAGQENIGVKIRVKFVGSSKLGDDYGVLSYATCPPRAISYRQCSTLPALGLVMQDGQWGEEASVYDSIDLGGALERKPGMYTGEEETGWRVWRIWKDAPVVVILKLDDDQTDFSAYNGIFAIP